MEKTNDVLKFAKQGNPKAIEAIFNKQLSASNIAVKAVVRDGCLQIMFESKQTLSQVTMVNGVKKVLTAIKPENIQTVKVYSKQSGDDFPKWHEEFELAEKRKVDVFPNIDLVKPEAPKPSQTTKPSSDSNKSPSQSKNRATESPQLIDANAKSHANDLTNNLTAPNIANEDSLLMEKAKWGDLGSISILLNNAFSSRGVSVSLNMRRDKVLGIALESESNDILDKQIAIEIVCRNLNKVKTKAFNEAFVSINTSESDIWFWTQNLIFKDNQFIESEDVVVIPNIELVKSRNPKVEPVKIKNRNSFAALFNAFLGAFFLCYCLFLFGMPSSVSTVIFLVIFLGMFKVESIKNRNSDTIKFLSDLFAAMFGAFLIAFPVYFGLIFIGMPASVNTVIFFVIFLGIFFAMFGVS